MGLLISGRVETITKNLENNGNNNDKFEYFEYEIAVDVDKVTVNDEERGKDTKLNLCVLASKEGWLEIKDNKDEKNSILTITIDENRIKAKIRYNKELGIKIGDEVEFTFEIDGSTETNKKSVNLTKVKLK